MTQVRVRDVAWRLVVALAVVGAVLFAIGGGVQGVRDGFAVNESFLADFTRHFLPEAKRVLHGGPAVHGFFYPPFASLFFAPFALLPDGVAFAAWALVQLVSVFVLALVPVRWLGDSRAVAWGWPILFATSLPVLACAAWGQLGVPMCAMVVAGLALAEAGRGRSGAFLVAVAISIKVYPVLVLVPVLLKRDVRFAAWTAAFAGVLSVVLPSVVMGPMVAFESWQASSAAAAEALNSWVPWDPTSQFVGHVVARVVRSAEFAESPWGTALGLGVAWGWVLVALVWARRTDLRVGPWAFAIGFSFVPFVVATSWTHYLVWLPLVQALAFVTLPERGPIRIGGLVALAMSVLAGSVVPYVVAGNVVAASRPGWPFLAHVMVMAALALAAIRGRAVVGD